MARDVLREVEDDALREAAEHIRLGADHISWSDQEKADGMRDVASLLREVADE